MNSDMEVRHLGREIKTALEIAIVALAPSEIVERLALLGGLLDALCELPSDSPPAMALAPRTLERGRRTLAEWRTWERDHLKRVSA